MQGDHDDGPDAGVTHEPTVETPAVPPAAVPPGLPPGYSKVIIRSATGSTYPRYYTPDKSKLDSRPKCWAHYRAAQ